MGATVITAEIRTTSENKLRKIFKEMQEEDRQYYGDDPYGANWSNAGRLQVVPYAAAPKSWTKKSKWAALDYLENRAEKYGNTLVIKTKTSFLIAACVPE